ncbi:MAG: hypothetical protein ACN2B6_10450 [Rickettsiales bacterium]
MDDEQKLEELMYSHTVPPVRQAFADEIISASVQITQKLSLWKYIRRMFAEFHLPAPAYSFASLVMIGCIFGFTGSSDSYAYDTQPNVFEQLLEDDGVL